MIDFSPVNIRTWSMVGPSGTFGVAAYELAQSDSEFAIVTSDLCYFSGLEHVQKDYPEKVFNVGIAEQNMIGIAAGMAKEGMNVWATTYASFASTRALDQVKVSMGYMKLPLHLVGLAAGFSVGILGATHMAIEDIAIMRAIPNIVILSPADCHEAMKLILAASKIQAPVYLRMTGTMRMPIVYKDEYELVIGKAIKAIDNADAEVVILSTGSMVNVSIQASKILSDENIKCGVYDMHTIKPLDIDVLKNNIERRLIVTVEEHSIIGGLGSAVAEKLAMVKNSPRHLILGITDAYPHAASYDGLLEQNGLTAKIIAQKIMDSID